MIGALAVTLALAFWAPYNGGVPPCQGQLSIQAYADTGQGVPAGSLGYAYLNSGCTIYLNTKVYRQPYMQQCEVIAHEIGHSYFGLGHSSDPKNIMWPYMDSPPRACYLQFKRP
jgi:hypothetical protein